jgi:hypothetical protein
MYEFPYYHGPISILTFTSLSLLHHLTIPILYLSVLWPIISISMIYDFTIEASHKIMVCHGFEYCGLIACHSSS